VKNFTAERAEHAEFFEEVLEKGYSAISAVSTVNGL